MIKNLFSKITDLSLSPLLSLPSKENISNTIHNILDKKYVT